MTFELTVLLRAILLPMAISTIGLGWLVRNRIRFSDRFYSQFTLFVWWLAVTVALFVQNRSWFLEESWQQTIVPLGLCVALVRMDDVTNRWRVVYGMLVAITAFAIVYLSLPRGEGWADLVPTMNRWLWIGTLATVLNTWFLDFADAYGRRMSFGILIAAQLGIFLSAASCYGSLGEWSLSHAAATLPMAIILFGWPNCSAIGSSMIISSGLSALAVNSRIYGGDARLIALALFTPALLLLLDRLIGVRRSRWQRLGFAVLLNGLLLGYIAFRLLASSGG